MELQTPDAARALVLAQALFSQMLYGPEGGDARTYLAGTDARRPVPLAIQHAMGLGFAASGYSWRLTQWGVPAPMQEHLGLIDAQGGEVYRERVTFPWMNMGGTAVTGMGGRAIVEGRRPKYVNTPDLPWFAKGRAVFGLTQAAAAIHGARWAIITEGCFDAGGLWEMGWSNATATVGAKVTVDQMLAVARLCSNIVVLLDPDEGGTRGRQALHHALAHRAMPRGLEVATAVLSGPKDAGDPACRPEHIVAAIEAALPVHI